MRERPRSSVSAGFAVISSGAPAPHGAVGVSVRRPGHSDALILPDLFGTGCFYFEACGKLLGSKGPRQLGPKVARVRLKDRRAAYLRLIEGGDKDPASRHLHLDLAVVRAFTTRPKIRYTRAAIDKSIARYFGEKVDVTIRGQFGFHLADIPAGRGLVFAGPNEALSVINGTTVEVTQAYVVLRDDDFAQAIEWQLYAGKTVFVDILARRVIEVSPSYLAELFMRISKSISLYVFGRHS